MTENKSTLFTVMIKKLQNDKDKFERIFAAQYLAKYNFKESKVFLQNALSDPDPDVVESIRQILRELDKI